jgi:hypothetical protein
MIDYTQLGMTFQLYAAEVLYNRALCKTRLNDPNGARQDLATAQGLKSLPEHDRIDEAMRSLVSLSFLLLFLVFLLFRPTLPK